MSYSKTEDGTS